MIPEAAVEAAWVALYERAARPGGLGKEYARLMLEAAAPHMLPAEYERGYDEGFGDGHLAGQESLETE